jgi:hypothetical protein
MRARPLLAACVLLIAVGSATAQQPLPQLLSVFPMGAKAGETVEVTCSGHNLDGSEKLLFSGKDVGFKAELVGKATAMKGQQNQPTSSVKFNVIAPRNFGGTYDVRVVTKNGLSNPRAFVVGDLTDIKEAEPNNDVGQAQKVELETTVNGVISAPTDVDYVSFRAKAGQNVVVYCLTTSIDSKMQADLMVAGPDGKPLASNHNYRGGDAVLDFKAPADGDYAVRVSQFAYTTGGYDHFYRLTVTTRLWVDAVFPPILSDANKKPRGYGRSFPKECFPERSRFARPDGRPLDEGEMWQDPEHAAFWQAQGIGPGLLTPSAAGADVLGEFRLLSANTITLDNEKNTTPADAQAVKLPCDIAGRIARKNERHWYKFDAKKGDVWTLEVFAERIGSPVDAYFVLTDEKGKVITEQDDGPDTLSPNQFYTKGDDPARYRFAAPADGTYKVMVSTREAGTQFGVRDQYVLRIAKEKPDFRVAVMPMSTHVPEGGTLPKGGAIAFAVFVFRFDGFNDAIVLSTSDLPDGVTCPPQVIGPGQSRGTLVLVADKDAKDWAGFVKVTAKAGELEHAARPFTITWPAVGVQQNQVPNTPMITRRDRGDGMALAVRGEAPFALTPTKSELTARRGGKLEVTLKVSRDAKFKDGIAVFSASPEFEPRRRGNQPPQPLATATGKADEVKVSIDVPNALTPGTHTLVLRGQSATPTPKRGNNAPQFLQPTHASLPISVTIEGGSKKK